jgi:hypothetical protein
MTTPNKQIEFLARAIVNRLEDRGFVEFGDAEEGIQITAQTLGDNFAAVDAMELEARQRLVRELGREPRPDEVESEMQRVAAERNFTL